MLRTCYIIGCPVGIFMSHDNLVEVCPFYRWNLSGCGHQSQHCSNPVGLKWKVLTSKLLADFASGEWEVDEMSGTLDRQISLTLIHSSALRALSHLFLSIIVFSRNTPVEETSLDTVSMCPSNEGRGSWACLAQEWEVNLEGDRAGMFPHPKPYSLGSAFLQAWSGRKDKEEMGERNLHGISAVIKSEWPTVVCTSLMANH